MKKAEGKRLKAEGGRGRSGSDVAPRPLPLTAIPLRDPSRPSRWMPPLSLQPSAFSLSRGFTLVEVALATLVISLGLLALVGLGRLAAQNAKEAEDDTRAAWLADDIFATLRATNDVLNAANNPAAWAAFWGAFAANSSGGSVVMSPAPGFTNAYSNVIQGNAQECTYALVSCGSPAIKEWSARYSITISNACQNLTEAISSTINDEAQVTLHIRPGTSDPGAASRTFYTHFTEHGTLP